MCICFALIRHVHFVLNHDRNEILQFLDDLKVVSLLLNMVELFSHIMGGGSRSDNVFRSNYVP